MSDKSRIIFPLIKELYVYIREYEESLEKGIIEYENEYLNIKKEDKTNLKRGIVEHENKRLNTKKGQGKLNVEIRFDLRSLEATGEYSFKIKIK